MESPAPTATFGLAVDSDRSTITVEHRGGDSIDVTELEVQVAVEDESLEHQPPVPFVGADGYRGTPSGPFNPEADAEWHVGERATLRVAETNTPTIQAGDTVTVTLVVDGTVVADLEAAAN